MDNSQASSSVLDTLRTVEFRLGLKGYNVDEVDEYLDKAAQEADALKEHVRQLNERLRQGNERIAQLEREKRAAPAAAEGGEGAGEGSSDAALSDETLQRTLVLAQKFVDQTKRESEAEASAIVSKAEEQARAAITAAEQRAAQLQTETHQQLREEVTRLEASRTELAMDVESMARHLEIERNRLRGTLSELLEWIERNVQPANSLANAPTAREAESEEPDADMADSDGGPPTMSIDNAADAAVSGASRPG